MLQAVRDGLKVVGIFYGHPGVFTLPSRRAIEIARSEGYSAQMLPGISAEDCLFADLLVDPSFAGAQSVEATDLLLKERPLLTTSHVIIWQVGCVGRSDFNFSGFNASTLFFNMSYLARSTLGVCQRLPHQPWRVGRWKAPTNN